jgi:hypothetical protein
MSKYSGEGYYPNLNFCFFILALVCLDQEPYFIDTALVLVVPYVHNMYVYIPRNKSVESHSCDAVNKIEDMFFYQRDYESGLSFEK